MEQTEQTEQNANSILSVAGILQLDTPNWNAFLNWIDDAKKLVPMPEEAEAAARFIEELQQMEHEGRYD